MKKAILSICVCLASFAALSQGMVHFGNNAATLVSSLFVGPLDGPITGTESYYFGLFTAPAGTTDASQFVFSGLYATNMAAAAGRFDGGYVALQGWAPGELLSVLVRGWGAGAGHDWNPAWMDGGGPISPGWYGTSGIGTVVAGGGSYPAAELFGASSGIRSGFFVIPEPSIAALSLLAAALAIRGTRGQQPDTEQRTKTGAASPQHQYI